MITYIPTVKKNPITKQSKWYAQAAPVKPLQLEDIAEKIAATCTVTEHDIKAVLSALQEQILFCLRDGNSVRLGDVGSFRLTLSGRPCETAEEVTADTIEHLRVRFTMSSRLRSRLAQGQAGIRFVRQGESVPEVAEPSEP